MNSSNLEKIAEKISQLSLLEASELVKMLEDKLGVSATIMTPMPPPVTEPKEEQAEFDVVLKEIGPKKIEVIKAIRQLTALGLREAKALVDGAPSPVMEAVAKGIADDARLRLEQAGAVVDLC